MSTVLVFPLSDEDTQPLSGTIDATLDFGRTGGFPPTADITVSDAAVSPLDAFSFTLGLPPLGVDVTINNAVASIATSDPPATMTQQPLGIVQYQFDATKFPITLNQGSVVATGFVNQTIDLANAPVSGMTPEETFGTLSFLSTSTTGSLTEIDAQLELPILFTEVVDVDDRSVTLDVSGNLIANGSFAVDLSVPDADFDGDGDVDAFDFLAWQRSESPDPRSAADLAIWTANYGSTPVKGLRAVPEPSTLALVLLARMLVRFHRRCADINRSS